MFVFDLLAEQLSITTPKPLFLHCTAPYRQVSSFDDNRDIFSSNAES